MVDLFQLREKEIFETLNKLKDRKFVLIGGYAINAYTLPRFSVDCDIVIYEEDLDGIERDLLSIGYKESNEKSDVPYYGKYKRFEKIIKENFKVSIDILINEVLDRQTQSKFSADWVFHNSKINVLRGKTIIESLKLRIINSEALFAMKMISCRGTDIRDIFLMISEIKDKSFIKKEVSNRFNFEDRLEKVSREINSQHFKDGLQGVFGIVDNRLFERNRRQFELFR
jgi:hypothetical protein